MPVLNSIGLSVRIRLPTGVMCIKGYLSRRRTAKSPSPTPSVPLLEVSVAMVFTFRHCSPLSLCSRLKNQGWRRALTFCRVPVLARDDLVGVSFHVEDAVLGRDHDIASFQIVRQSKKTGPTGVLSIFCTILPFFTKQNESRPNAVALRAKASRGA